MKKNIWSFILVLCICCSVLAGCKKNVGTSEDNAADVSEDKDEEEAVQHKFGFTSITMENPYYITLESAIRETLEKEGHILITKDPRLDSKLQIQQIEEMIEDGIEAIFLSPVDWEAITPAIETLKEAKVKIINIDTQIKEIDEADVYIGSDNVNAGYVCGEDLAAKCPDGGKVVILECPTMNSVNDRITGFEQALAEKPFEVVARKDTKGDLELSRQALTEILKEQDDIVAVMCGNDQTALGALVAANALNEEHIRIYGVDGSPDLKKELKKQETLIAGTGAQSPINMGKTAAKTGIAILEKEHYEKEIYEETFLITKDNVDMYGVDGWQ